MRTRYFLMAAVMLGLPLMANATCDQVKSDIDAKIQANGVGHYTLEVVPDDQADNASGKVVGNCEGNKKIIYTRGASDSGSMDQGMDHSSSGSTSPASASSS